VKIATYNVNGINGRLPNLLSWLAGAAPDIVCLQELKAPDETFPATAIRSAGYGAIWHGQKSWNGVAILARGAEPRETRRGLPGDPDDMHSRYIEAAINGIIVGCLHLPNGNPAPAPRFNYKMRWFERLMDHAKSFIASDERVVLGGDCNVMPTDLDVYAPERWLDDALFWPEVQDAYRRLVAQHGRTPSESYIRGSASTRSGLSFGEASHQGWCRPRGARPREKGKRPRTSMDRTIRCTSTVESGTQSLGQCPTTTRIAAA
jgi:exodeoxyribonuclease III